jgi:hypothetical protein
MPLGVAPRITRVVIQRLLAVQLHIVIDFLPLFGQRIAPGCTLVDAITFPINTLLIFLSLLLVRRNDLNMS